MKTHLIFYSFCFTIIIFLTNIPTYSAELFSKNQRQLILETIDNTCADSWCEGDYNFEFVDFSCSRTNNICDLNFYFINNDNDLEIKSKLQFCHFANIIKIEQIIDKSQELNNLFYEALDACISGHEVEVQFN
jgi:hypothetical protein